MPQSETSPSNSNQKGPSGRFSENKYIFDFIVRLAIVGMVSYIEWYLLRELNHVKTSESFGLLAAIVVIAFLLVLSLTLFKGSLEQDVQELKKFKDEDVHKLEREVKDLSEDLKKLEAQIKTK